MLDDHVIPRPVALHLTGDDVGQNKCVDQETKTSPRILPDAGAAAAMGQCPQGTPVFIFGQAEEKLEMVA